MKRMLIILSMILLVTGCSDSYSSNSVNLEYEEPLFICGDQINLNEFTTDGDLDTDSLSDEISSLCRDYVMEEVSDSYRDECNEDMWVDKNGNKVMPDYQEVVDCTLEDIFQD